MVGGVWGLCVCECVCVGGVTGRDAQDSHPDSYGLWSFLCLGGGVGLGVCVYVCVWGGMGRGVHQPEPSGHSPFPNDSRGL